MIKNTLRKENAPYVNSIIFLVLFLFSACTNAQNPITVSYQVKNYEIKELKYAVLEIFYKNKSSEGQFLWIQDWRVIALDTLMDSIHHFPDPEVLVNGLIINANQRKVTDQIVNVIDAGGYNPEINCYTVKHLNPGESFLVKMIFINDRIVDILKGESFELIGKVNYIKASYFDSINEDVLFHNYPEDSFDVLVPADYTNNSYFNVESRLPHKINRTLSENNLFHTNKFKGEWIEFIKSK